VLKPLPWNDKGWGCDEQYSEFYGETKWSKQKKITLYECIWPLTQKNKKYVVKQFQSDETGKNGPAAKELEISIEMYRTATAELGQDFIDVAAMVGDGGLEDPDKMIMPYLGASLHHIVEDNYTRLPISDLPKIIAGVARDVKKLHDKMICTKCGNLRHNGRGRCITGTCRAAMKRDPIIRKVRDMHGDNIIKNENGNIYMIDWDPRWMPSCPCVDGGECMLMEMLNCYWIKLRTKDIFKKDFQQEKSLITFADEGIDGFMQYFMSLKHTDIDTVIRNADTLAAILLRKYCPHCMTPGLTPTCRESDCCNHNRNLVYNAEDLRGEKLETYVETCIKIANEKPIKNTGRKPLSLQGFVSRSTGKKNKSSIRDMDEKYEDEDWERPTLKLQAFSSTRSDRSDITMMTDDNSTHKEPVLSRQRSLRSNVSINACPQTPNMSGWSFAVTRKGSIGSWALELEAIGRENSLIAEIDENEIQGPTEAQRLQKEYYNGGGDHVERGVDTQDKPDEVEAAGQVAMTRQATDENDSADSGPSAKELPKLFLNLNSKTGYNKIGSTTELPKESSTMIEDKPGMDFDPNDVVQVEVVCNACMGEGKVAVGCGVFFCPKKTCEDCGGTGKRKAPKGTQFGEKIRRRRRLVTMERLLELCEASKGK